MSFKIVVYLFTLLNFFFSPILYGINDRTGILVIGNNAVDRVFFTDQPYAANGKRIASAMQVYYGGQAANVAYTLASLSEGKVTYVGVFGTDDDSATGRQLLKNVGVDVNELVINSCSNTASIIVNTQTGDRYVTFYPAISTNLKNNVEYESFVSMQREKNFDHVSYIYSDCRLYSLSKAIFEAAMKKQIPVVLDVEIVNNQTKELINYSDYLITNESVIRELSGQTDLKKALEIVAKNFQLKGAVATLGADGYIAFHTSESNEDNRIIVGSGIKVWAQDATGAGDAFHAAFIAALANNMSFASALQFANFVASEKVKCQGPRLEVPRLKNLRKEFENSVT
ncbi:MAG: carbohydrate kinase family protein [Chlamydiales bacterium]|nr:carbohydrate kinase family protein [Chlamydiia bacterium]MCP5508001.1 carbohydrate kinase family protein [Chlamydiales bacterium]